MEVELYEFHPLFEFFLTFYVGYIVIDDFKKILDEKVIKLTQKSKDLLMDFGYNRIKDVEELRVKIQADFGQINNEDFKEFKGIKDSEIKNIEHEIRTSFFFGDRNSGFIQKLLFTKELKSLFLYYALYSFCILIVCGIIHEPSISPRCALWSVSVFNLITSGLFLLAFLGIIWRRITIPPPVVILIFATLFILIFFVYHAFFCWNCNNIDKHYWLLFAIFSSLITFCLPITILTLRAVLLRRQYVLKHLKEEEIIYDSKFKVIYNQFAESNQTISEFISAKEKLDKLRHTP